MSIHTLKPKTKATRYPLVALNKLRDKEEILTYPISTCTLKFLVSGFKYLISAESF